MVEGYKGDPRSPGEDLHLPLEDIVGLAFILGVCVGIMACVTVATLIHFF